jgi:hypothetical protein
MNAFLERLLDLLPIYCDTGRQLARLAPADGGSATELADAACRRWLLDAVPADAEGLALVADALAQARSVDALIVFARDVATVARQIDDDALAASARHAEATACAAAAGRDVEAGRAAADCLYSRLSAGTDYIVAEARAVTEAVAPADRA